jgi:hypothetical protein
MTKEQFIEIGRALYGSKWQEELARNIINLDGVELDSRRVRQWACGARPVPAWLLPELKKLAQKRKEDILEINKILLAM